MKGDMKVNCPRPTVQGPGKVSGNAKTYDTSGPKGMRQTYQETGKPGNGSK